MGRDDSLVPLLTGGWIEPGDIHAAQKRIAEAARETFGADICAIYALNPITGEFSAAPILVGDLRSPDVPEPPRQDGVTRKVLREGRMIVEDLAEDPQWISTFSTREEIRSFVALPLGAHPRPEPFAVLYIDFRQPRRFDEADLERLAAFAEKASSLLQNAWRYWTIITAGQEINQELGMVEGLFRKLDEHVSGVLDTSYFFMLATYFVQTGTMDVYSKRDGAFNVERNRPITAGCRKVIQDKQKLIVEDYSADQSAGSLPELDELYDDDPRNPQSLIFIPLLLRDVPLGVLSVQSLRPKAYDQDDIRILETLANHVASALNSIRLFEDLETLNRVGQLLTGELDPQVLQRVVETILTATRSDLVILYPYHEDTERFHLPPTSAGDSRQSEFAQPRSCRRGDIQYATLDLEEPRFLEDAAVLYAQARTAEQRTRFQVREGVASVAEVPLRVGGETVGTLYVNYRHPQIFTAPQRRLISDLSVFAAIAIKNARKFQKQGRRIDQESAILRKIDAELVKTTSLEEVLETILTGANKLIEAEHASILLVHPSTGQLQVISAIGQQAEEIRRSQPAVDPGRGITRWAFENREPVRVGDVQEDPRWKGIFLEMVRNIHSELDVPLEFDGTVIGVINFESTRRNKFSAADERFAGILAGQVVLAVKKAQIYQVAESRLAEQAKLIEITRQMVSQLDLKVLLHQILRSAIETTGASIGMLLLYDVRRQELEIREEQGTEEDHTGRWISLDKGIVGLVARERSMLNIDPTEPFWAGVHLPYLEGSRSELAVPLLEGERLLGVLNLESRDPRKFLDAAVRSLVMGFADMAVVALQNSERYEAAETGRLRLKALQEVSQEIIRQSTDPEQVMKAIVVHALDLTRSSEADLDLYEGDKAVKSYYFNLARPEAPVQEIDLTAEDAPVLPRGIIAHVAETRHPYWTPGDAQKDEYYVRNNVDVDDVHSEIAVPLVDGDTLIGVLNIDNREPFAFDKKDADFLKLFADEAVIAIQNARSHARAERELERFRSLYGTGQKLGEISEVRQRSEAYTIVTEEAVGQSGGIAVVRVYEEATQELLMVKASGAAHVGPFERMKVTEGLNGHVFRTGKTARINDTRHPPPGLPPAKLSDPNTRSLLITPIKLRSSYYGNLALSHTSPNRFTDDDEDLIEGLAGLLAITLHRLDAIQKEKDLQEQNRQNELMGWIGEASYSLAHRLNNDMGLISSYVNFVRESLEALNIHDPEIEINLQSIVKATSVVLNLSKKLRDEVSSFKLEDPHPLKLETIFSDLKDTYRGHNKAIEISFQAEEGLKMVRAVESYVADILRNLIDNALEAMPEGGRIEVSARNADGYVEVCVSDNGPGIQENDHEDIFKFLYSSRQKHGTGFGLWSSRRKAQANSGQLRLQPGTKGATFVLTLPRTDQTTGGGS